MTSHDQPYYHGIDALRFLTALLVAFFHLGFMSWASGPETTPGRAFGSDVAIPFGDYAKFGWVGVPIFFVISGFVIANSAANASALTFLRSRILRLYPAAWVCATLTLLAWLIIGGESQLLERYLRSMSLWIKGPWIDGVYWTLAVEIAFYAIVFVLVAVRQFSRVHLLAWALSAASSAFLAVVYARGYSPLFSFDFMLPYGCHFSCGMFLWLWSTNRLSPAHSLTGASVAAGLGLAQVYLPFAPAGEAPLAPAFIYGIGVLWVAISARKTNPPRFAPLFRTVGLMTYPLYLLHDVVGIAAMRGLILHGVYPFIAMVGGLIFSVALSFLVCRYAEPLIRAPLRRTFDYAAALPSFKRRPTRNSTELGRPAVHY
jgi:exopolysaccharide production protein ExoZ